MKRLFFFIVALVCMTSNVCAQDYKQILKERKAIREASRKELNEKATKDARKDAKKYAKEGWEVTPGALPLVKQLDRSYLLQMEYDDNMYPKYIMGEARSIGENYDAAKMQAEELAKQALAGQIQTEITALIENSVANKQLGNEEAASVTQSVLAAKNLISQNIGRTLPMMECYRVLSNKNKEVLLRIAYSRDMAKAAVKQAIREELKSKGEELQNKLDKILGW